MLDKLQFGTPAGGAIPYVAAGPAGDVPASCRRGVQSKQPTSSGRGSETSADTMSDDALVVRVAKGDRRAVQLLFARHQQRLYRFALRLVGNRATAEDIVSDVFVELWRNAASFEGRAQLSTWLLAIARNKAFAAMRDRVVQPLEDAIAIPDPATTAEETLDASKRGAVLRKCLDQLSAAHREIIDLVYYHEKSVDEVSTIVGIPAATVKTRMFYARKRLSELLRATGAETAQF
jgi:RNA polymerase sigma-70 factor (ECF subfamily)